MAPTRPSHDHGHLVLPTACVLPLGVGRIVGKTNYEHPPAADRRVHPTLSGAHDQDAARAPSAAPASGSSVVYSTMKKLGNVTQAVGHMVFHRREAASELAGTQIFPCSSEISQPDPLGVLAHPAPIQ